MSVVAEWNLERHVDEDGFLENRLYVENLYLDITDTLLPSVAKREGWDIVHDHCFQRICYDVAYGDEWYEYVDGTPAYENIEDGKLLKATVVAIYMLCMGEDAVEKYNERSLYYRDEISEEELAKSEAYWQ